MALIKRYSNRKLYDTAAGSYVTLEEIAGMVRAGEDVRILDHESGRDLTSLVLLQALMGEEKRLGELLPRAVLTSLLRSGEERVDSLRARLLAAFDPQRQWEEELRRRVSCLVERGKMPADMAGEIITHLLAADDPADAVPAEIPPEDEAAPPETQAALASLRDQLDQLERQLAELKEQA